MVLLITPAERIEGARRGTITDPGLSACGLAAIALGGANLALGKLADPWHAVPDAIPHGPALVILIGPALILAGAGLQARQRAAPAAILLAVVHLLFAAGWLLRVIAMPALLATCWGCVYAKETADMVPAWLPPARLFWARATGIAHALAGIALISGILTLLAAGLLTAMFLGFGLLVRLPILLRTPDAASAWGGNAVKLALVAAAWAMADSIARYGSGAGYSLDRLFGRPGARRVSRG